MRDDSLGIYCIKDKTFYYLETGKVYVANTVDRIKKTLIHRDLIEFTTGSFLNTDDYKIITCRDAKLEDYKIKPIYISEHIRRTLEETTEEDTKKAWK